MPKDSLDSIGFISTKLFGPITDRYEDSLSPLKSAISEAGMSLLFRTYVSIMFFFSFVAFFIGLFSSIVIAFFFKFEIVFFILSLIFFPILSAFLTFIIFYFYPFSKASSRKKNVEMNLPFAINHISAIAGSGIPSYMIFKLLTGFEEYGEISKEAQKIVRNVDTFGMDVTSSMREVANKTPSKHFKEFLEGMISSINIGGNLQLYLKNQADKALFEYRLRRERYLEILSTYADFYTAVMIAAPLFLVAILAIMNMIGGKVFGMEINDMMSLGIFVVIPIVNVGFLAFVNFTQPEV